MFPKQRRLITHKQRSTPSTAGPPMYSKSEGGHMRGISGDPGISERVVTQVSVEDTWTAAIRADAGFLMSLDIASVFSDKYANSSRLRSFAPAFRQFALLPAELRYAIWEYAIQTPTVIPWVWNSVTRQHEPYRDAPPVWAACAESRRLAARANGRLWQWERFDAHSPGGDTAVWINWWADALWLTPGSSPASFPLIWNPWRDPTQDDLARARSFLVRGASTNLRHLVMDWDVYPWTFGDVHDGVRFIREFPDLRDLRLLVAPDDLDHDGLIRRLNPDTYVYRCCLVSLKRRRVRRVKQAVRQAMARSPGWDMPPQIWVLYRSDKWERLLPE